MEEIRLSQTQTPSSASSTASQVSLDDSVSTPATINKHVITDQVLGVRRGHCKGIKCIIKGRRKESNTTSSSVTTWLSEQSTQAVEEHRLLHEQVYAQQRELEALKGFITQKIGPPPPPPLPPPQPPPLPLPLPPPSSNKVENLCRD